MAGVMRIDVPAVTVIMQLKVLPNCVFIVSSLPRYTSHLTYITVDDLERCNSMVGREEKRAINSKQHLNAKKDEHPSTYFPFKQGHLAISTLRIGLEGIHMTVDGKHVTSFPYKAVTFYLDHDKSDIYSTQLFDSLPYRCFCL
jgi:hypothetical protein